MTKQLSDQHVVVLTNYLRRHHVLTFKEVAQRVGRLTILVSTPMEGDRKWEPEWEGLNVIVQSNSTVTMKKSSGYAESNFIHFPWDTISKLRKLKPDIVLSYEMGMRTMFCGVFRMFNRNTPVVMIGNMSDYIERERGILRRTLRRVIKWSVDCCTYNGPSCKKYLKSIGLDDSRLFHFPYCYDPKKTYKGEKKFSSEGVRKLLYCGVITERKAIVPFIEILGDYCDSKLDYTVELQVAGDGPLRSQAESMQFKNLKIVFLGLCDQAQLQQCYAEADLFVFPTRSDEWGLVPIEAWASGVPVLGSQYAQSVETVCKNGHNGWVFDIYDREQTEEKIAEALATSTSQLQEMSANARESVVQFTGANSAILLCKAINTISGASASAEPVTVAAKAPVAGNQLK